MDATASETMRQVMVSAESGATVRRAPIPVPQAGEALVEMISTGVCGSDTHALHGLHPALTVQLVAASAVFSLSRREADIVISVSRPPAGRLRVSKLIDYDLALYAAPVYLATKPPLASPCQCS